MSRAILAVLTARLLLCPLALSQERRAFTIPFHTVSGLILLDGQLNGKPAVPVAQEPKPATRVPHFNRKAFIAEVSLFGAAKTADAITTRQVLDRGGWENNPIFGRHPSPAKQAGINLGIFAAQSGALYLTEHSRRSWIRRSGRDLLVHAVVEHAHLAACNASIDMGSPRVQNCKPFLPF